MHSPLYFVTLAIVLVAFFSTVSESRVQKVQTFVTRPDIAAPIWDIEIYNETALSPGYFFVAPYHALKQIRYLKWNGPLIYDGHGRLIWSGASLFENKNAFDFRTFQMGERQMLSLLTHVDRTGFILDNTYELQKRVKLVASDGMPPNFHDFSVIDDGRRALVLTRTPDSSTAEESKLVGFDGSCTAKWEGCRERDLFAEEDVFEWSSHGHIGLNESTWRLETKDNLCNQSFPNGWGITHMNSVDKFPDGDYLISARHTSAIYKVSRKNGTIVWRFGGVMSDFQFLDGNLHFSRQHHARVLDQNTTHTVISFFDNAHSLDPNDTPTNEESRGLIVALSTESNPMTASVVQEFTHPDRLRIQKRGSVQMLPTDNVFICWAESTAITEHAPDGTALMKAAFKVDAADSYRGYKFPWVGNPLTPPDVHAVALETSNGARTLVHVSWNGATEVAKWRFYRMNAADNSTYVVGSALRSDFETCVLLDEHLKHVIVEAVDAEDNILGQSNVHDVILQDNSTAPTMIPSTCWTFSAPSPIRGDTIAAFAFGVASCIIGLVAACVGQRYLKLNLWLPFRSSRTGTYELLDNDDGERCLESKYDT